MHHPSIFTSFWLAGFESACHVNRFGTRLDMIAATQHDTQVDGDYARLRRLGIGTVRDTVRWHLVDHGGHLDFGSVLPFLEAASRHRIQVIWDLCHYGWPEDVSLLSSAFVTRFAHFCRAFARLVRDHGDATPLYTPINEISFLAWAAGEEGWFHPHYQGRGAEVKRQLVRATIEAIEAVWTVDPRARIVTVEPVIHVVPPLGRPDLAGQATRYRDSQFEAWDMLSGRTAPDLGGHPRYLDVMGVNFYHDNQWEHPGGRKIAWHIHPRDPRWVPFHRLLGEVYDRYERPIFVGETSHVGSGRAEWIREMTDELLLAIDDGIPLEGICLYPIVDRFEWNDPAHWHNSGLWDVTVDADGVLRRVLNGPYAAELERCRLRLAARGFGEPPGPPGAD